MWIFWAAVWELMMIKYSRKVKITPTDLHSSTTSRFILNHPPLLWSLLTLCDVKVEEVAVEDGLHDAGHHGDLIEEALGVVTPHPVGDVEGSVEAEEEQVVGGDGLRLAGLGDHEELRHDGHRLQEDGEGPQDLDGNSEREIRWF